MAAMRLAKVQRDHAKQIKRATVAVGLMSTAKKEVCPYRIFGFGFCIDSTGIIVTCRHVVECFHAKTFRELTDPLPKDRVSSFQTETMLPFVFFFDPDARDTRFLIFPVPVEIGSALIDFDIAVLRIKRHQAFQSGYPVLETAEYSDVYDGVEIGTCGFPLGDGMREQLGTLSSSLTFGRLSSTIPSEGVLVEHLKGFQLDLTATHGNSGGPVFLASSGKVFGILERGVQVTNKALLPGVAKAEPIYRLTGDPHNLLDRIKIVTETEIRDGRVG